jgi:hypothetical protein
MSATPKHPIPPDARGAHSLHRLVGRCRNCGGRKRDRKRWYCDDCRISLKIPKKDWVQPNYDYATA